MSDEIITFNAPEPEELSKLLNSYDVYSLIAQGGMGAVYQAMQTSLERPVAIKLLPKELGDDAFKEQFAAEARAMAKLNHPNLIGIYDFGKVEEMPFIVMELVEGKSLYYSCYEKAIEQSESIRITTEICSGLAHAHEHDIVHRDIKPANILLDGGAHVKIGDFGLATGEQPGGEGFVFGTPGYAAPEVTQDPENVGVPADIFAVGVILHQLLTGKMPDDDTRTASRQAQCHPQLDRIIRKATHLNPESRYATCDEMIADLEQVPATRGLVTKSAAAPQMVKAPKKALVASPAAEPKTPATLASGSDTAPPAPAAAPMKPGSNWPLMRNLVIIAILIPVLILAIGRLQDKNKVQEQELAERQAEEEQAKAVKEAISEQGRKEAAAKIALAKENAKKRAGQIRAVDEVIENQVQKTPREELNELQGELRGGSRSKFPKSTIKRGTDHFFFVEEAMSWSTASEFAETYGAHLATPILESGLTWIGENQGEHRRSWIGGGALGESAWGWVTGEEWNHKKPATTLGSCAALSRSGLISARPNGEKLPFFIQWSADGINKGSLDAQLERLKETLGAPSPAWPPGTVASQGRAYLLVQRSGTWDDADLIASSSGGHLAVSSDSFEKEHIRKMLSEYLGNGQAAWIGGSLAISGWTWVTRETWDRPDWAPNSPSGGPNETALRFLTSGDQSGWDDAKPAGADAAQAFLIEWSKDLEKAPKETTTADGGAKNAEIIKLRIIGARHLTKTIGAHRKLLQNNQKGFIWDVNSWVRNQPKSVQDRSRKGVEGLKNALPDTGALPADLPMDGVPGAVHNQLNKARERQARYDATLEQDISKFRRAYLGKLLAARKQAEDAGFKAKLPTFDEEVRSIGQSVESFRAHFGMDE